MIMPFGSDKTLRVDEKFDVLHELNRFDNFRRDRALLSSKTADKSLPLDAHLSNYTGSR